MKEILLTQNKIAIVDDYDFDNLNKFKWFAYLDKKSNTYYARRNKTIDGKQYTVLMHREIMGITDTKTDIYHINHDGLNNQRSNLLACTHRKNMHNLQRATTSKYMGVHLCSTTQKWYTKIYFKGKSVFIGLFDNEEFAAREYDKKAIELLEDKAILNFPII